MDEHHRWPQRALWALFIAALGSACGSLDYEFDFKHESPTYVIESPTAGPDLAALGPVRGKSAHLIEFTGGWTGFKFDPEVGKLPPELIGIKVQGVDLVAFDSVTDDPVPVGFVERMELYVLGVGDMPSFLLATYLREGTASDHAQAELALSVVEDVNLKDYLEAGAEFYCFLQGVKPEGVVAVQLLVDFYAYTRANP